MKFATVAEARKNLTKLIALIEESGEEIVITKNGKPVVLLRSVSEDEFRLCEEPGGEREAHNVKDKGNL